MTYEGLLSFVGIYALSVASPGPGVAAVAARAMASGASRVLPFILGIALADIIWAALVMGGLTALAARYPLALDILRYAGAAYLAYIAFSLWRTDPVGFDAAQTAKPETGWRGFGAGVAITLGNPKAMVFFLAILPQLLPLASLSVAEACLVWAVMAVVLVAVMGAYALLGAGARILLSSPYHIRRVNRGTAVIMLAAAVAIALT
jgi:threonine/homoserine/homoserine lactone efflux protein